MFACGDEKDSATLLRYTEFLGFQNLMFDMKSQLLQRLVNFMHSATASDACNSSHVLHDNYSRHQPLNHSEVLSEQAGSFVVHSSLVIVNTKGLARWSTDEHIEFTAFQVHSLKQRFRRNILDESVEKLRRRVIQLERFGCCGIKIVRRQNIESSFLKSCGHTSGTNEQVNCGVCSACHGRATPHSLCNLQLRDTVYRRTLTLKRLAGTLFPRFESSQKQDGTLIARNLVKFSAKSCVTVSAARFQRCTNWPDLRRNITHLDGYFVPSLSFQSVNR